MSLTPEQQKALDLDRNVALSAGAGSGKTRVLVERYTGILLSKRARVDEIVAITFTEKAADEMKRRVRLRAAELLAESNDPDFWEPVLDDLLEPRISTIHSFCASLLREFPVQASVDPFFNVADEMQTRELWTESLQSFFRSLASREDESYRLLLRRWSAIQLSEMLGALLSRRYLAVEWSRALLSMNDDEAAGFLRCAVGGVLLERIRNLPLDRWITGLNGVLGGLSHEKAVAFIQSILSLLILIRDTDGADAVSNAVSALATLDMRGHTSRIDKDTREFIANIRNAMKPLAEFSFGPRDAISLPYLRALASIYSEAIARYDEARGGGLTLDFDELQIRALRLIETNETVRRTLRSRFKFILVDEFQDTDPVQWKLISALIAPVEGLPETNLFLVGDEKQSIYGFRGADVGLFVRARDEISGFTYGADSLNTNFRSHPALLRFFNDVLSKTFSIGEEIDVPIRYKPMFPGKDTSDPTGTPRVEWLASPWDEDGDSGDAALLPARYRREAALIASRIRRMVDDKTQLAASDESGAPASRPLVFDDVAILLRSRTHLKEYEQALRDENIPYTVVGGIGFHERQEIMDVYNILKFLADVRSDVELVGALRSPFFGLSDDQIFHISLRAGHCGLFWHRLESWPESERDDSIRFALRCLRRWRGLAGRIPLSLLLRRILDDTGILALYETLPDGARCIANIEKLCALARSFESDGALGVSHFADWLLARREEAAREGEANVSIDRGSGVRVMTVHAAKGLEFPVVAVPNVGAAGNPETSDPILIGPLADKYAVGITVPDESKDYDRLPTGVRKVLSHRAQCRARGEDRRLLYVACTRAAEYLLLSGFDAAWFDPDSPKKPRKNSWAELLLTSVGSIDTESLKEKGICLVTSITGLASSHSTEDEPPFDVIAQLLDTPSDGPLPEHLKSVLPLSLPDVRSTFSVTEILTFSRSPEDYRNHFILGVPVEFAAVEDRGPRRRASRSEALIRGGIVHHLFEQLCEIPSGGESAALERLLLESGHDPSGGRKEFIRKYAARAASFRRTADGGCLCPGEAWREIPFQFLLGNHVIVGTMDVLYRRDGLWTILDYKTNNIKSDEVERLSDEYRVQLEIYALAARAILPDSGAVRAGLYFIEPETFGPWLEISDKNEEAVRDKITGLLRSISELRSSSLSGPAGSSAAP